MGKFYQRLANMVQTLLEKFKNRKVYSRQFWLLFWGAFFTRASISMIWPFVTIYIRQKLDIPLTTAALLLTVQAIASIASTFFIGSAMDRFGRKLPILFGLGAGALVLLSMSFALFE